MMARPSPSEELERRLAEERARLRAARADYEKVTRSRFHGLRMLWFAIKQVLGFSSPADMYAVWSPGLAPSLSLPGLPERTNSVHSSFSAMVEEEARLVDTWRLRTSERPMSEK